VASHQAMRAAVCALLSAVRCTRECDAGRMRCMHANNTLWPGHKGSIFSKQLRTVVLPRAWHQCLSKTLSSVSICLFPGKFYRWRWKKQGHFHREANWLASCFDSHSGLHSVIHIIVGTAPTTVNSAVWCRKGGFDESPKAVLIRTAAEANAPRGVVSSCSGWRLQVADKPSSCCTRGSLFGESVAAVIGPSKALAPLFPFSRRPSAARSTGAWPLMPRWCG